MNPKVTTRFVLNTSAVAALNSPGESVGRATRKAGEKALQQARAAVQGYGRVDTGRLLNSSALVVEEGQAGVRAQVYTDVSYAIYVHQGTSRGLAPAPFLTDAIHQLDVGDFT